jgi:hypothetical protein
MHAVFVDHRVLADRRWSRSHQIAVGLRNMEPLGKQNVDLMHVLFEGGIAAALSGW